MDYIKLWKNEEISPIVISPKIFRDERGYFFESYSQTDFNKNVYEVNFVQDNESKSSYGVLRGLHFQKPPYEQAKLVRVINGAVFDVAVDIRKDSPTFGHWVGAYLSEENHRQFFIPRGFAHGFIALKENTIFQYKCDNIYNKESEGAITYDDPDIKINWGDWMDTKCIKLSSKDQKHPTLKEYYNEKTKD